MKLSSIAKKGFNYLERLVLQKYAVNDNMFYIGRETDLHKPTSILFYFPNPEFMHLGDQLFFEPLARFLKNAGYKIAIIPTEAMEFYFKDNGYKLEDNKCPDNFDLIISRPEFYSDLKSKHWNVLYIDTASHKIKNYLCQDMICKVSAILNLDKLDFSDRPAPIHNYPHKIELDHNDNYLLFNNYIDSGFHRVRSRHYDKIGDFAKQKAKELGLKVIHIGTINDRNKDKKQYNFVDIDLRGKTNPADLFYLASLDNIRCNVSFDAFLMHVFAIYGKKSFVLFRGRTSRKISNILMKYLIPPFKPDGSKSELIEFI